MDVREPDWAYMARSLIKVLAVTTALFLLLGLAAWSLGPLVRSDDERMVTVYGTAARVANPDKRLSYGYGGGGLLETSHILWGEPRRAGRGGEDETRYEIVEGPFGTVRAPFLDGPSGSLGILIDAVAESPGVDESVTARARKTIDGLPPALDAIAVVAFADSMPAERLVAFNRRHKICGGADVSYIYAPSYYDDSSGEPPLNAVVWNRDMAKEDSWADLAYQCETEPEVALAEFRTWVGRLDAGDDLRAFELNHESLAGAAKEGVVHGLVVDRWKLADLRKLLDDPEVRTVDLAEVAFDLG